MIFQLIKYDFQIQKFCQISNIFKFSIKIFNYLNILNCNFLIPKLIQLIILDRKPVFLKIKN
jgi:hypothetical protein